MIIVKLKGGMGNQMFQYAIGRALSIKNNTKLGLDLAYLLDKTPRSNFTFRNYDLDIFNIHAEIIPQTKINFINKTFKGKLGVYFDFLKRKFIKSLGIEKSFNFDSSILGLKGDVYLDGYWQSPKYFEMIEDVIREDFTLKYGLPLSTKNLIEVIEKENSVCIHVRRGDYVGNKFHEIVGKEYYNNGIDLISKKIKIDKIYVFSDDIKWCEENMKFEFPVMFVGEEYAGEKAEGHLMLMKSCKNFIIPNSSFSWWAAWLSNYKDKIVIVPKQWFGNGSINSDDLIPKEWIRI
jgi:hypothetical protein